MGEESEKESDRVMESGIDNKGASEIRQKQNFFL